MTKVKKRKTKSLRCGVRKCRTRVIVAIGVMGDKTPILYSCSDEHTIMIARLWHARGLRRGIWTKGAWD